MATAPTPAKRTAEPAATAGRAIAEPRRQDGPPAGPSPERHGWIRRHRILAALGAGVAALVVLVAIASFFLDGTLRKNLESRINQHLQGYKVTLDHAHLQLLDLRLTLRGLTIRQEANPDPPVAAIERLRFGIVWNELVRGHLVADVRFTRPHLHVNLPQIRREATDKVSLRERGWQQAFESIYPLKVDHFHIDDGDIVYVDEDPAHPLQLSHVQVSAENIRNIQSRDRTYPSPIHAEGTVFDVGKATIDGDADFLARPYPGVHALYHLAGVPLARLKPIAERGNVSILAGSLSSHGEVEYAPKIKVAHVAQVDLAGLKLDYLHSATTAPAEKARGKEVVAAAKKAAEEPGLDLRVDRLAVTDGELGFVDRDKSPGYRVFVDRAQVAIENLSNDRGPALVQVKGRFMGSGSARATARFKAHPKGPDLGLQAAVENTSLPALNDLLRAYTHVDVAAGTVSVYTEVKVHDGRIEGYVKPLFHGIQVYAPHRDRHDSLGTKIKEKLVNVAAKLLTNHRHHDVATVADLSGPVDSPRTSLWRIALRAVGNAFVKSILPGFEHTYGPAHDKK